MMWPKRIWLIGNPEIGDIWFTRTPERDVKRLWKPSQRRVYVLAPLKKRKRAKRRAGR